MTWDKLWDLAATTEFVSSLAGAAAGAMAAFALERRRDTIAANNLRFESMAKTIFAVQTQRHEIGRILSHLNERRNVPHRHVFVAKLLIPPGSMNADLSALGFLIAKLPAIAADILGVQHSLENVRALLQHRYERWVDIRDTSKRHGFDPTTGQIALEITPERQQEMRQLTDALYRAADQAQEIATKLVADLLVIGERMFPGKALPRTKDD